jgi:hypothetical protein
LHGILLWLAEGDQDGSRRGPLAMMP